jgi:hypothetical protein
MPTPKSLTRLSFDICHRLIQTLEIEDLTNVWNHEFNKQHYYTFQGIALRFLQKCAKCQDWAYKEEFVSSIEYGKRKRKIEYLYSQNCEQCQSGY